MNKNLKTILLGIFTLITSTEMMYPIIFTGPARRDAHRQQQEAYSAGMAAGSTDGMMTEQEGNSSVAVQMLSGDSEDYDNAMDVDCDSSDDESNNETISVSSGDEPYNESQNTDLFDESFIVAADDENSFNDEPTGYGDDLFTLGQAQEDARQEAVAEQQESPIDLSYEGNFYESDIDEALQDAQLNNDDTDAITRNLFGNDSDDEEYNNDNAEIQSIEPEVKSPEALPVATPTLLAAPAEKVEEVQVAQDQPVEPVPVVTPVEKAEEIAVVEEVVVPVVQVTPVAAPVQEQVKIVKVYPVYDALRSAVKAVNNATHDLINYIYSFVK